MARLSKKAYYNNGSNGSGFGDHHPAVYDDVFRGGPPRFGLPTLSPRVEDYAEIFGGFHASHRASSIPILDLPPLDDDHGPNLTSSHFDYSQVFATSHALDFALTFEQLFNSNNNSYHEAWTPAQSESLSDESDPSACSERSQSLSNGESHQSCDGIKHFNISYDKSSRGSNEDISTGMSHRTQLLAVPGFTCVFNGNPPSQKMGDRDIPFPVTDDLNPSVDFSGRAREGKQFRKTVSHQATNSFGTPTFGTDLKPVGHRRNASCMAGTFVTVTDISLRTQPSQLPPPLRLPPVLTVKDGDSDAQKAKSKASKSFSLGATAGDNSPPFLDVEVDASSSAAISAAAMKHAMENAEAKIKSVKELAERKKEGLQSCTKLGSHNDAKYRKEKPSSEIDLSNSFNKKRALGTFQRDCSGLKTFSGEERKKLMTETLIDLDSTEGERNTNLAKISADKKHVKDNLSQECNKSDASVAWRQAHNYQLAETDKSRNNDHRVSMQNATFYKSRQEKKETAALQEQEDDNTKIRDDREALEWDDGKKERSKATKVSSKQGKLETNVNIYEEGCEQEENGNKQSVAQPRMTAKADKSEECENLAQVKHNEHEVKVERILKEATEKIEDEKTQKDGCEREENERRLKETLERERHERRLKEATERAETEKRLKEALDREEIKKQQGEASEIEKKEKRQKEARKREENEKRLNESLEQEENKKKFKEALEREDTAKKLKIALEQEEKEKQLKLACERDENEERLLVDHSRQEIEKKLKGAYQQGGNGENKKEAHEREENAYEREEHEMRLTEAWEQDENERRLQEACGREEGEKRLKEDLMHEETDKRPEGANDCEGTQKGIEVAGNSEEFKGRRNNHEQHVKDENGRRLIYNQGTRVNAEFETLKRSNGAVEVVNVPAEEKSNSSGLAEEGPQHEKNTTRAKSSTESLHLHDSVKSVEAVIGSRQIQIDEDEKTSGIASNSSKPYVLSHQLGDSGSDVEKVEVTFEKEETEDKFMSSQVASELVENGRKMRANPTTVLEGKINAQHITQKVSTSQYIERKGKSLNNILAPEEREKENSIKRERELEKDCQRKIEEEREREREREKDRMAVDRAGSEARESAFVEAREKVERAVLERATSEVRQRVMAEARERLEKTHAEARERSLSEKGSLEARLRAERAAVERATSEARERAFQKAMNEKATFEARERVGRSVADKASASCNTGGIRQSASFTDLQDMQCQGVRSSRNSYSSSYSSVHCGVEGESAQRCKARLERHQRTAERAAKALAEKNMRDLLALKEQTEKNRLAEALDVEVKRWSSGKEGNLRALLSTLQYILGPDSGWQPIPLTEVITSAAVKKAYRKATLCVHPDKLQQRGASIQRKYICEKVFDLLKEAWNKFNSEER